jgi:hypothetical protein
VVVAVPVRKGRRRRRLEDRTENIRRLITLRFAINKPLSSHPIEA